MRKRQALVALALVSLLLAACGNKPVTSASAAHYNSLDQLVSAAEKEGSVVLYADFFPDDDKALAAAWAKKYPKITLKIQSVDGTKLQTRFESEVHVGAPSADVITTSLLNYYRTAAGDGLIVPLEKTGVLKFVPDYPKKYIWDDLDTALIQGVPTGMVYNTRKVPSDQVPKDWNDLLDPFWKGHITTRSAEDSNNTSSLLAYERAARRYGADFLPKLAAQLGPPLAAQPMLASVAAGQTYLGLQTVQFAVDEMKAQGAPIRFIETPWQAWAIHGFGVSAHAEHPAAARLLAEFLLTKEGSESVSSGDGAYGPYDTLPAAFAVPSYRQMQTIGKRADQLLGPFRD